MTEFDKREEAFEKKFAIDEELRFKATARRNRLMGLWVAGLLGKTGDEADAYAKSVILADFEEAGDGDVLRKVKGDLEAAGKSADESQLRLKLQEFMAQSIEDMKTGR
ncbi:DUF1476 domain-containing protein [Microvirga flavescens]|uniref:DUF1476 domain-containing protein n=1 Tax=Microvirga flavescens TaxID=2249811 RepID=UPI000DDACAFE|nr:DUF1476 domain-containing protein [Microvirga flavescens]